MKKVLLSTIVLLAFSASIVLFQLSCKKSAAAQTSSYVLTPATTSRLGGVIPDGSTISVDANGKISAVNTSVQEDKLLFLKIYLGGKGNTNNFDYGEIWTANYDGTNQEKLTINLPSGFVVSPAAVKVSPDRKTIFFGVYAASSTNSKETIYACNIDGSNAHQIISDASAIVEPSVAY